jgi:hypothetical protein
MRRVDNLAAIYEPIVYDRGVFNISQPCRFRNRNVFFYHFASCGGVFAKISESLGSWSLSIVRNSKYKKHNVSETFIL